MVQDIILQICFSSYIAVNLNNVFGYVDKLVDESLTIDFGEDPALVIISVKKDECVIVTETFQET